MGTIPMNIIIMGTTDHILLEVIIMEGIHISITLILFIVNIMLSIKVQKLLRDDFRKEEEFHTLNKTDKQPKEKSTQLIGGILLVLREKLIKKQTLIIQKEEATEVMLRPIQLQNNLKEM